MAYDNLLWKVLTPSFVAGIISIMSLIHSQIVLIILGVSLAIGLLMLAATPLLSTLIPLFSKKTPGYDNEGDKKVVDINKNQK